MSIFLPMWLGRKNRHGLPAVTVRSNRGGNLQRAIAVPRLDGDGKLDIATAQEAFARDWIAAYRKHYGGD
jgi:hypothetical protein